MKVIPKLQQGNTIESDNTKVVRPEIHEPIKAKPRQYSIVDLGGEPSNDTRSAAERNRDYWHPIKGAKARFRASMSNETNPLVGIERTILPSAAGAALVTTPAAVVGGALGNMTVDKLTGGWGNWLEDKTGIPSEIGVYTNPGAWYGGAKGYKIGKDKLITKSIKDDADLAWNPINKNHWIFNKEARTPSNIAMATANRITPFLSKVEKLPLKVAAYKAAKRTNGNASVSLQDIKTMPADYTGSSILGGGNLEGRNLLAKYIFDENPVVKRMFFNKATSNIKPISRNEARRGFSHGDRYEQLYPGVHNRRYEMSAVVPSGRPLKFENVTKFTDYAGKNPISKVVGKETEPVMRMGDKEFMTFRQPGTDYIGPIDDVAGHLVKFQMNKGKLRQTSQDMWKFNPADYAKRWNDSPNTANQVRLIKQAALMDKVGRPFILQQSNPIWIEGKSVRNPELVTMAHGGRFDFKKSPLLKKQEEINGKRDMRKKFIKSSRPTYKKRIKKAQQGMRFVSYNPVSNPTIDYTDITNPINPFSEYNYNTTYDKPEALVVPVRDTNEPDVVANNPTVEPVINKPVASKPVTDKPVTANSTWKSPYTNRKQWATELINAYKKAGITNDNAIRMLLAQDALESSWGKSAQGKYNFGNLTTGSSWKGDYVTGNDKNAKGEAIKQKFRSYNSMDEYAADKIQFLKRLYDFDENDDINKFVAKLTGSNKGKRRYAEAKEYANSLRGVYNSFKAGGIIKYQNPAQPIARRDAIKDYRPEIPFSPIKQPVKPYMPTQQPILSPDNRTGWEKEVSRQIKADRAKNDNLYGNQHTWNWSAPFTNARITKDNASAMFDFDKSAAMSTFAIGQGIASPVTTATSIAGSLVGAGIGNKVAGEKGALVGGFVGGMVNPKFGMRFNKKNNSSNIKQPMVMAKESKLTPEEIAGIPKGERNQPIKSKLDWKNWSKGGPISKEHLAEYAQIERDARRRGYWLMTEDSQPWKGDPRTWVQLMSKDGSRFKKGKFPSNNDLYYHGLDSRSYLDPERMQEMYLANDFDRARTYTNTNQPASPETKGGIVHLGIPNTTKPLEVDAKGASWHKVISPFTGEQTSTDVIKNQAYAKGYDAVTFDNILDNGAHWASGVNPFAPTRETVINNTIPRKSLIWNNGDFNINNPNIYKVLAPFLLIGGLEL
jgi:flagellum-specific peptidoglycan hydrolase FlgJ